MTRPTGWKSYDSVAEDYDRLVPPLFGLIAGDLVELVRPAGGVLDVGTGTGVAAASVAEVLGPGDLVVGIDPSLGMLARAGERVPLRVAALVPGLPFGDGTFDVVVANLVLSHFPDVDTALDDFVRVLRPGGRLGATAWPEEIDDPESDSKEASGIIESSLEAAGLAVDPPEWAVPLEGWLRDAANLGATLAGAGLEDVRFSERAYPRRISAEDYLDGQLWGSRPRYLRTVTDEASWRSLRRSALVGLGQRFPDGLRSNARIRIAVARKPG